MGDEQRTIELYGSAELIQKLRAEIATLRTELEKCETCLIGAVEALRFFDADFMAAADMMEPETLAGYERAHQLVTAYDQSQQEAKS